MCSWFCISLFRVTLHGCDKNILLSMISNIICAYILYLVQVDVLTHILSLLPKQCRFGPLRYQGRLKEDMDFSPSLGKPSSFEDGVTYSTLVVLL